MGSAGSRSGAGVELKAWILSSFNLSPSLQGKESADNFCLPSQQGLRVPKPGLEAVEFKAFGRL